MSLCRVGEGFGHSALDLMKLAGLVAVGGLDGEVGDPFDGG